MASETLLTFAEAAEHPAVKTTRQAVWRWADQGVRAADGRRVKLEALQVGGVRKTSVQALQRFAANLTARISRRRRPRRAGRPAGPKTWVPKVTTT